MIDNQLPSVWQVWLPAFLLCLALLATGAFVVWLYRKARDWDARMAEDHLDRWRRESERRSFGKAARGVDLWRERGAPFDEPTEHQASRRVDDSQRDYGDEDARAW